MSSNSLFSSLSHSGDVIKVILSMLGSCSKLFCFSTYCPFSHYNVYNSEGIFLYSSPLSGVSFTFPLRWNNSNVFIFLHLLYCNITFLRYHLGMFLLLMILHSVYLQLIVFFSLLPHLFNSLSTNTEDLFLYLPSNGTIGLYYDIVISDNIS